MTKLGNFYRWFHGYVVDRPTNFSWIIEDNLAGSGMPMTYSQFSWVLVQGIKTIVTIREVPLPSDWLDNNSNNANYSNDIDYLHLKVEDYGAPSIEDLDYVVDYIQEKIDNNKPVMVHCAAGRGRTGTILAAYLIKKEKLTADQAIRRIRKLRPGSIQSITQENALDMYEKYLQNKKKKTENGKV
ncbi:MAG: dual specificity protein phosphatase 23 [Thermoproteota archaeon]|nr:dual specificity protein phosphatase 23 [Thermoproteota archaeon]